MSTFNNKLGYLDDNFKLFHIRDKKELNFDYHHHDFNKIIILISGNAKYFVEGKIYDLKPWDILFINHNEIHKPIVNPDVFYERIVIWVKPKFEGKNLQNENSLLKCFDIAKKSKYNLLRLNNSNIETLKNLVSQIVSTKENDDFGKDILNYALFLQSMVLINRWFIESKKNRNAEGVTSYKIIEDIIEYINSNINSDLSIETLASRFNITRFSISRHFKNKTGNSLHNYIVKRRLVVAKELIGEGYSMKTVAEKTGFKDYSTFVRAFKKEYKMPPREYLKNVIRKD